MDLTSVLKNELFRPTATLVIPGGVATSPYVAILFHYFAGLKIVAGTHTLIFLILLFLVAVGVGLIVEDLGARIEEYFGFKIAEKNAYKDLIENWRRYWRLSYKEEPIGHRYLRTIILRLKFELNMSVSLGFLWIGLWCLFFMCKIGGLHLFVISLIIAGVAGYLLSEAWASVKLLADIRKELLKGVDEPPMP